VTGAIGARSRFAPRQTVELGWDESIDLLASVPFGRVVFTRRALPAIRPVNHAVLDGLIVIRTLLTARLGGIVEGEDEREDATVVAYEADRLDADSRLGWSVVVTGVARRVSDPELLARSANLVSPWIDIAADVTIAIEPHLVNGIRLIDPAGLSRPSPYDG